MQDSAKYLIHASIRASGVVERSDVVGAIFGQTEGLLGDELDLRNLQESSKVGHIDVDIESEGGRSYGSVTVASGLDRVETAVLAAALETIERVGPCRADIEVVDIEDARAAKRRDLVERAADLLADFEQEALTSTQLVDEVRQRARVADITEYEGLPAGPRVADSDAVIVVEGRADVRQLLQYGIKNAVAVEGTDIPDAIAKLTAERTVTAFLDGDRGGDLILRELAQVGDVDYVAVAPDDQSVEDLSRDAVVDALRKKIPYEDIDEGAPATGATDRPVDADGGSAVEAPSSADDAAEPPPQPEIVDSSGVSPDEASTVEQAGDAGDEAHADGASESGDADANDADDTGTDASGGRSETLSSSVDAIIGASTGRARLLDEEFGTLAEVDADEAFDAIEDSDPVPATVVLDGEVTQRILDVAAQRGVDQVVAASTGSFVKQPTSVRVRTAAELESS